MTSSRLKVNRNKVRNGPLKGVPLVRTTTRISKLFRSMVRCKAKAVRVDTRSLASYLGVHYRTMQRRIRRIADNPSWSYKAHGYVLFQRQTPHRTAKCGCPQWYVINRFYGDQHGIGGSPGRVRSHLRHKRPDQWIAYMKLIFKLAWSMQIRKRGRAKAQHNGSPNGKQVDAALARPPPTANRPALRRFDEMASAIQLKFRTIPAAPEANVFGWARHRLHEQHSFDRILDCLRHAIEVMPGGRFAPANPAAWISAVAKRHLDRDGLEPIQRKRDAAEGKPKRQAASAATLKVLKIVVDNDGRKWEHLGGTNWRPI